MRAKGGLQLAASMQVNTAIRTLKVGSADLEVDSVIAMATILHGNSTLQVLDLSRPLLFSHQEETARHLSNAMKVSVRWLGKIDEECLFNIYYKSILFLFFVVSLSHL